MWISILPKLCLLCYFLHFALSYHHGGSIQQDYIADAKGREGLLAHRTGRYPGSSTAEPSVAWNYNSDSKDRNSDLYDNLKLRHHRTSSRYPSLDKLETRIKTVVPNHRLGSRRSEGQHRVRHLKTTTTTTTTEGSLFYEDYGEEDDNDHDWDDDGDNLQGDDQKADEEDEEPMKDDDYVDDVEDSSQRSSGFQAEEASQPPVVAPSPGRLSTITQYKWDNYGTRSQVEKSRREQMLHQRQNQIDTQGTNAAMEHYMKVRQEGQCRNPVPKVIPVQSEHPDPSKIYTPHCTILYRCAEDTGCCSNFGTKCGPKSQVAVELYFYSKLRGKHETMVEKLTFLNHTECDCIDKNTLLNSTTSAPPARANLVARSSPPQEMRRCECPELFVAKFRYSGPCSCDCEDNNDECIRMKKGKEHFGYRERLCIKNNVCGLPMCEYGPYLKDLGRCTLKTEKIDSYSKLNLY